MMGEGVSVLLTRAILLKSNAPESGLFCWKVAEKRGFVQLGKLLLCH